MVGGNIEQIRVGLSSSVYKKYSSASELVCKELEGETMHQKICYTISSVIILMLIRGYNAQDLRIGK